MTDFDEVRREAHRLEQLPRMQALRQFGDRVARTFQLHLSGGEFVAQLDFNALLATESRGLWA